MTYKEIKKQFDYYEKNINITFFERGEGRGTNHNKDRNYLRSIKKRDAAFSALFDIYTLYKNGVQLTFEKNKKLIDEFKESLKVQKKLLEKTKNLENSEESQDFMEKIEDIDDLIEIYPKIFSNIFELNEADFRKMMNYAKKRMNTFDKLYIKTKKDEDNRVVDELTSEISRNHYMFNKDRIKRENKIHHVGTPIDVIKAYEALITKEKIIYNLLLSGVKNALNSNGNNEVSKESILTSFASLEAYPVGREFYADEEAYDLSRNCFELYDKTYKSVFLLSKKAKNKLGKNLKNHLN